eukprot:3958835-Prymnesium_polylepis.1
MVSHRCSEFASPPCCARRMDCTPARSGNNPDGASPRARLLPCPPWVTIVASRGLLHAFETAPCAGPPSIPSLPAVVLSSRAC